MEYSKVTEKGQLVIPAAIRRKFGIKKGTRIAFLEKDGKIIIQPIDKDYIASMAGILGTGGAILRALMEDKKYEREL